VRTKLEVRSFTRSWDNTGYWKNFGSPWIRPRNLFSQIFKGLLFAWTLWIYVPNLKFVAVCVPRIIRGTPKIRAVLGYAHAPFSPKFQGSFFGWILWIYLPNLKFVALRVPEIIGGTQKFGQFLDTPTLPFCPNFACACVRMDPMNVSAKFAVCSFSRSWDNSDCSLRWGCELPILGKGTVRGGDGTDRKNVCDSYRLSIVNFPLSLRVSDILPLLCSSTPLFPTPPLISPTFPHVPLGIGGWPLGY